MNYSQVRNGPGIGSGSYYNGYGGNMSNGFKNNDGVYEQFIKNNNNFIMNNQDGSKPKFVAKKIN